MEFNGGTLRDKFKHNVNKMILIFYFTFCKSYMYLFLSALSLSNMERVI